jgi:hypothetical protein
MRCAGHDQITHRAEMTQKSRRRKAGKRPPDRT